MANCNFLTYWHQKFTLKEIETAGMQTIFKGVFWIGWTVKQLYMEDDWERFCSLIKWAFIWESLS
ncbi:hypothetical protein A33Q_1094 [Indibacter alkaliphilus LW1]|jgi:hypothetical protein|uniref:Uncharacterized protein n=1 Tax=Indibacter alkaliphilus (strain CCUG 57479 / KCTC 22604 / LW1) TaxID=1189612 RepID=S2DML1_INDAL|nr:hypothetical protein [Indibacter alkaliphilus]EOZ98440.1 hypothetical protein A33Q_1094 [Indibacter alkaliphilus LW1]